MTSNLPLLERIARQMKPLLGEVVFVGGAVTELFFTAPAAARVRITRDADVICEVAGRVEYRRLGERLRALGFSEDSTPGAPLCRWRSAAGILDVMPIDEAILGFSNRWYEYALRTARSVSLPDDLAIRTVAPTVFLATKLAAFEGRGGGDLLGSHDIEDVVSVIAARREIVDEMREEASELRRWVAERIRRYLIDARDAEDAVVGSLPDARILPELVPRTRERLSALARLAEA